MAIAKNEIEKYIFDPDNPKQCKSYNLLLRIAKKEYLAYLSSEFVAVSFKKKIFNNHFYDEY